jgi:hypothetical protein
MFEDTYATRRQTMNIEAGNVADQNTVDGVVKMLPHMVQGDKVQARRGARGRAPASSLGPPRRRQVYIPAEAQGKKRARWVNGAFGTGGKILPGEAPCPEVRSRASPSRARWPRPGRRARPRVR